MSNQSRNLPASFSTQKLNHPTLPKHQIPRASSEIPQTPINIDNSHPSYQSHTKLNLKRWNGSWNFFFFRLSRSRSGQPPAEKERNPFRLLMIAVSFDSSKNYYCDYATRAPKTVLTQSIVRNKRFHGCMCVWANIIGIYFSFVVPSLSAACDWLLLRLLRFS